MLSCVAVDDELREFRGLFMLPTIWLHAWNSSFGRMIVSVYPFFSVCMDVMLGAGSDSQSQTCHQP